MSAASVSFLATPRLRISQSLCENGSDPLNSKGSDPV
jgi:hypothetical protein